MQKKVLFVNSKAGRAKNPQALPELLTVAQQQPDLQLYFIQRNDNLAEIIAKLIRQGVTVIGAAGGDGTISSVAAALVKTNIPLVVIPFGTLNHFARDIGVPSSLAAALSLFADGTPEIAIDVGSVNNYYFLNNSSIGLYPKLVRQREKYEKQLGKSLAYLLAGWHVLRQPNLLEIKLSVAGTVQNLKVGLVFFSNNRASMSPLEAGRRARFTDQILDTYLVAAASPLELFRIAASFLRGKLEQSPLVTQTEVGKAIIYASQPYLRVACDGETRRLPTPLIYTIHPAALLVRIPALAVPTDKA